MPLSNAKWIWGKKDNLTSYNQTIIAKKTFEFKEVEKAIVAIAVDSYYRLYINSNWVEDGPCRSWPEHFQYDVLDVTDHIRPGVNEIKIVARYYGVGDYHKICMQAGLLFKMDVLLKSGESKTLVSDEGWEVAKAKSWICNTPKVSNQMEPYEFYDARLESDLDFQPAKVLFAASDGPWKDLHPRDVSLLTKKKVGFISFISANIVKSANANYCLPVTRLMFPDLIETNTTVCPSCGMATILEVKKSGRFSFSADNLIFSIDGIQNFESCHDLQVGRHLLLVFVEPKFVHIKERVFHFIESQEYALENPVDKNSENPWCLIRFPDFAFACDDIIWPDFIEENKKAYDGLKRYKNLVEDLFAKVTDLQSFKQYLGNVAESLELEKMFLYDPFNDFRQRKVISQNTDIVSNPDALFYDNQDYTLVSPCTFGDVELVCDLGEQNCGYLSFDLIADEGVRVDITAVEYISEEGLVQKTDGNRNGLTYITRSGRNCYLSLKRRSGRYFFITLRNQKMEVQIRNVKLIESTYPISKASNFKCSDETLNKIWDISARSLKLCMEDVFTDCPLYEQTLWVGDARNEALCAYAAFGSTDISKRCILLAAQSLERYPMVASQVPSSWASIIPIWSFLWGISVWEYYIYTGDKNLLNTVWPAVIRNLRGASQYLDENGLFNAPLWNLFDWTGIDQNQKTVLHNSMFFVGAIDAAKLCADALLDDSYNSWFEKTRERLCKAINNCWLDEKKAYADSVHSDGSLSDFICVHTSFLSVLYDIVKRSNKEHALNNVLNPRKNMTQVGSPFAMMFLYEMLEKVGMPDKIIESILKNYQPMLDAGATTVWETFLGARPMPDGPSRSHCHGWSCSPLYFFNRIVLGVRPIKPGYKALELSPRITGLDWATGSIVTVDGTIDVGWQINKGFLEINCSVPKGTQVKFIANNSYGDLHVEANVKEIPIKVS